MAVLPLSLSLHAADSSIEIDGQKPRIPVSPVFYGAFFEEINRAGDGGLYAEMIRNRSFEDAVLPERSTYVNGTGVSPTGWTFGFPEPESIPGWSAVSTGDRPQPHLALDAGELMNSAQLRSLRIGSGAATPGGLAGVEAAGFRGLSLEKGKRYRLSFWAKCASAPGGENGFAVSLHDNAGRICATTEVQPFPVAGSGELGAEGWQKWQALLTSDATDTQGTLRMLSPATGDWWLDMVSLFPEETFRGRPNGLRPDLVDRVAALQPKFLRFPGGCIVEGFSKETIWNWKNTVGDIDHRRGHTLLWNYRTTTGLGFHEFLQLCEDLEMTAMYVFNCGLTCQARHCEVLPDEAIEALIQDALDGIEYAIGSAEETKWGALRAKNGHPKPFDLQYVEIGNENYGPLYEERYARFHRAIRVRYPQLKIIATAAVTSAPIDILDEHFYPNADFFIARHDHYDSYDRSGPKIYVGEYAVTQDVGRGNLRAALGEAAFLTGMERNQDVVVMTSYAPLFAHMYDYAWLPSAIYFDNHRTFGTPFYHVMKLFAENRGSDVLSTKVTTPQRPNFRAGSVSFETEGDAVRFSEQRITSADGAEISKDAARLLSDYVVRAKLRIAPGAKSAAIRIRDNDRPKELRDFCILELVQDSRLRPSLKHVAGWSEEALGNSDRPLSDGNSSQDYLIEIRAAGPTIECLVDGRVVISAAMKTLPAVTATSSIESQSGDVIIKLVNTTDADHSVRFALEHLAQHYASSELQVITSGNLDDENSLEHPERVAAKSSNLGPKESTFEMTFAPWSINVLRLRR